MNLPCSIFSMSFFLIFYARLKCVALPAKNPADSTNDLITIKIRDGQGFYNIFVIIKVKREMSKGIGMYNIGSIDYIQVSRSI